MVWATVLYFKKNKRVNQIFQMVKYVKEWYPYFNELYRIRAKNLRNDYVFAIALQQLNGFVGYDSDDDVIIVAFAGGLSWVLD